jgi:hypothetical protein
MVDKGFMKIATGLTALVAISAVAVGVYLYFNFNSQSRLPLIVPNNTTWFVQIQTKKLKEDYKGKQPPYYDSVFNLFKNAAIFKHCTDPATPGVGLFSDVVLFETDKAQFLSLSVTSDTKFDVYLDTLKKINVLHGKVVKPNYSYTKVIGKNIYIAYKYKAMVIMRPFDTTENIKFNESALDNVFSGKESKFIQSKAIQTLYDKKAHVIWYHKHLQANKKNPIVFANGINLGHEKIQVFSIFENNNNLNSLSQFDCAKFTGSNLYDAKYLHFGTRASELANSSQTSNNQTQQTSSYYLNSLFRGMYDYLKILK